MRSALSLFALFIVLGVPLARGADVIRPKVVIVATFETGADTGDAPGEFQFWVEREKLTQSMSVPGVDHPVRFNDQGVFGVVSGTTQRAGLQIMALCLDPRFDLTKTYWIINGIAGVNPDLASIGSAAWAAHVVDGDLAFEIDSHETPADWPYGILPLGAKTPNEKLAQLPDWTPKPMCWTMNPALVQWAYQLTKDVELADTPEAKAHRALYTGYPNAQKPAFVLIGDSFGSDRYWHGPIMQRWAAEWTKLYTEGKGRFAMTNMEDHGIANALDRLSSMDKVDFQRVLFLRTGSNFCLPHPGQSAVDSMTAEYAGNIPALEAAYRTGSVVLHQLLKGWDQYRANPPR